jgi:hypothetical protein
MVGDGDVHDAPPLMSEDDKDEQEAARHAVGTTKKSAAVICPM